MRWNYGVVVSILLLLKLSCKFGILREIFLITFLQTWDVHEVGDVDQGTPRDVHGHGRAGWTAGGGCQQVHPSAQLFRLSPLPIISVIIDNNNPELTPTWTTPLSTQLEPPLTPRKPSNTSKRPAGDLIWRYRYIWFGEIDIHHCKNLYAGRR